MSDHVCRLQYSDDGGHTWSDWDESDIGAAGQYGARSVFTRLGSTYVRVWKVRVTSPRKRDFLGAVGVVPGSR